MGAYTLAYEAPKILHLSPDNYSIRDKNWVDHIDEAVTLKLNLLMTIFVRLLSVLLLVQQVVGPLSFKVTVHLLLEVDSTCIQGAYYLSQPLVAILAYLIFGIKVNS